MNQSRLKVICVSGFLRLRNSLLVPLIWLDNKTGTLPWHFKAFWTSCTSKDASFVVKPELSIAAPQSSSSLFYRCTSTASNFEFSCSRFLCFCIFTGEDYLEKIRHMMLRKLIVIVRCRCRIQLRLNHRYMKYTDQFRKFKLKCSA